MLQVKVTLSQRVIEERIFNGSRVTIGRTPDNDIQIDNPLFSRRHAELVRGPGGWEVRDAGSRNGIYIAGKRVSERCKLLSGDTLVVGKFSLLVRTEEPESEGDVGERLPGAFLTVKKAIYALRQDAFQIGGAAGCDLRVQGLLTPPQVALVVRGRSGYRLIDVSPTGKGVYHNGKPLQGHCRLRDGDRLEVAGVRACFHTNRSSEGVA